MIIGKSSYIDTLQIWIPQTLSPKELALLKSKCGSIKYYTLTGRKEWIRRLLIQRPTLPLLQHLLSLLADGYLINRIDIALDLDTRTAMEADHLTDFFVKRINQRWRGSRKRNTYHGVNSKTDYWSKKKWTNRNIAVYRKLLSKNSHRTCCHIEIRFKTARYLRSQNLDTFQNLIKLHHREFWSKQLCLRTVNFRKLSRVIENHTNMDLKNRKPMSKANRAHYIKRRQSQIARTFQSVYHSYEFLDLQFLDIVDWQNFKDKFPFYASKCYENIDNTPYLP